MNTTQLRRRGLTATAIVLAFALSGVTAPAAQAATDPTDVILEVTNDYRADAGEAALSRAGLIDNVAQRWAERLRSDRKLSHNPSYSSQMPATGRWAAGENVALACGQGGPKQAAETMMRGWFKSDGHRRNMENSRFTHIGIGFAYNASTDCGYGVQNFGGYAQNFFDVPRTHHFYDEIEWLAAERITTGFASGEFRPRDDVSREAFAAFLYRLAGSPSVSLPSRSPFKDVSTSAPFYKEIVWLSREGITTGWSDGTFRPRADISREAIAAFLYRFEGEPTVRSTTATSFADINKNSAFLKEISWLAESGITTGYTDGTFRPLAPVTREATAAFLERAAG
ncbi:S-layer homology domain-containing protein [Demequina sp. SO4-18]|uniref:CAP and S-layer homology domain-containing protein n=1 Tax=Demequina sp. SO4-18 TaxID=3401026 RepID=UPI003B5BEBC7